MSGTKWFSRAWTVAWGMALAATVAAASPIPVGSLVGSRNAMLDGQSPLAWTTILSGDKLEVNDGLAIVTLGQGNRVVLGRGSQASFERDAHGVTVSLERGGLSIIHPQAGSSLRVKAGEVTVKPDHGLRTLGEIAMVGGQLMVRVKEGTLRVEQAGKTKEIREGNTIRIATTDARTAANAAHGNAHLKHVLNRKKLVVLGTAAGGAAAALAAIGLAQPTRQVSPVTPGP